MQRNIRTSSLRLALTTSAVLAAILAGETLLDVPDQASGGDLTAKTATDDPPDAPTTLEEARGRARLLHETIHGILSYASKPRRAWVRVSTAWRKLDVESMLKEVKEFLSRVGTMPIEAEQAVEKRLNAFKTLAAKRQESAPWVRRPPQASGREEEIQDHASKPRQRAFLQTPHGGLVRKAATEAAIQETPCPRSTLVSGPEFDVGENLGVIFAPRGRRWCDTFRSPRRQPGRLGLFSNASGGHTAK